MRDNRRFANQSRQLPPWLNMVYSIVLLILILTCVILSARLVVRAFEQKAQITTRLTNDTSYEEREL